VRPTSIVVCQLSVRRRLGPSARRPGAAPTRRSSLAQDGSHAKPAVVCTRTTKAQAARSIEDQDWVARRQANRGAAHPVSKASYPYAAGREGGNLYLWESDSRRGIGEESMQEGDICEPARWANLASERRWC
jgi:hypothetical protein